MFGRLLRQPIHWLNGPESNVDKSKNENESAIADEMDDAQETPVVQDHYEPTVLDVIVVKEMLHKALNLPPEIVDEIVDLAEYWPHTSTEIDYAHRPRAQRKDARGGHPSENSFLLRTPPLGFVRPPYSSPEDTEAAPPPQLLEDEYEPSDFHNLIDSPVKTITHPCRKIVFTFVSHDQGWGNTGEEGLYSDSWTWFEVGLERCNKTSTTSSPSFDLASLATLNPPVNKLVDSSGRAFFDHPLSPQEHCKVQCNVTVNHEAKEHRIVWSYQDDVVVHTRPDSSTAWSTDRQSSEGGNNAHGVKDFNMSAQIGVGGSSADGAAAANGEVVAESAEVKRLAEIGRGKATGDGEFVRNLKLGDIVTVWAKARFPGWVNYVERVKVDVYWAI